MRAESVWSTEDMVADVLTKPATKLMLMKFDKFMFGV